MINMAKHIRISSALRRMLALVLAVNVAIASMLLFIIDAAAIMSEPSENGTMTGYASLVDYEHALWDNILDETFVWNENDDTAVNDQKGTSRMPIHYYNKRVRDGNPYFNWKADVVEAEGGSSTSDGTEIITYPADSVQSGANPAQTINISETSVTYTVYNVANADQLEAAMSAFNTSGTSMKINLLGDIDLKGDEQLWTHYEFSGLSRCLYIEGNGYTIYNMKSYRNGDYGGFIGTMNSSVRLVMKNLNFSNCITFANNRSGIVIGYNNGNEFYLENVNVFDSMVFNNGDNTGTLIGRSESYSNGNRFIRNCSASNCYVRGTDHSGSFTGCQFGSSNQPQVKYDAPFPEHPETWVLGSNTNAFSEIIENCYTLDCTAFSVGNNGDSGAFISCGNRMTIRNCFTNSTVYGRTNTGAFIGRIVTTSAGNTTGMYDDAGKQRVELYCENCYASGSVEGTENIGGFAALETPKNAAGGGGVSVFKNCYSTAMVGMDFAGTNLGGFMGKMATRSNGNQDSSATIQVDTDEDGNPIYNTEGGTRTAAPVPGSVFINCYAAGEVGNINTFTDTDYETATKNQTGSYRTISGANMQGGFLGFAVKADLGGDSGNYTATAFTPLAHGTFVNCYYDMQTTGMRERAVGFLEQYTERSDYASDLKSQIPGVTGVYTECSEAKGVPGLTGTEGVSVMSASSGSDQYLYGDEAYPRLKQLSDSEAVKSNFGSGAYVASDGDAQQGAEERIKSELDEKIEIVRRCSAASTSTVLLSHWDSTMNMDTGSLGDENNWIPGLNQNKLTRVADNDRSEEYVWNQSTDGYHWEITYEDLTAGEYEMKIQQGGSWAYNFGSDKFNGSNCMLQVPRDCDVTVCFDYEGQVSVAGEYTNFKIWAVYTDLSGDIIGTQELGKNESISSIWTVAGSFAGYDSNADWSVTYPKFNMSYIGDDKYMLTLSDVPAGSYEFKIAKNNSWAVSYGLGGTLDGANMSFTLGRASDVTFVFDEITHMTEVSATVQGALTEVNVESPVYSFDGYSVIGAAAITGHGWLDNAQALEDGRLTYNSETQLYESQVFVVSHENFGKGYGYKVIENGEDKGSNNNFFINTNIPEDITEIGIKFTYDSVTGIAKAVCVNPNNPEDTSYAEYIEDNMTYDNFGVLGTEQLTGFNWDSPNSEGIYAWDDNANFMEFNDGVYTKTYSNVPAGDHAFKIAANGTFDTGVEYGQFETNENYVFTTNSTSDVTITFDRSTGMISVQSDAIEHEQYVVSGNEALTGENFGTTANLMTQDPDTGLYTYTISDLSAVDGDGNAITYAFKVVKYGMTNSRENEVFTIIDHDTGLPPEGGFRLNITYDSNSRATTYTLTNSQGDDCSQYIVEPTITSYSVLGDIGLTGYNWDNAADGDPTGEHGEMTLENGVYVKRYENVDVSSVAANLSFKVAANGTFSSGLSYGNSLGGNYSLNLVSPNETVTTCSVTIYFDPNTHQISVTVDPSDCLAVVNEDEFEWYVCGDYRIVSSSAFIAAATTYDTVRDITSSFTFTAAPNLDWALDDALNTTKSFDSSVRFNLDYTVDGKNITGTFGNPVLEFVDETVVNDDGESMGYTQTHCYEFIPGKQYVDVSCSGDVTRPSSPPSEIAEGDDTSVSYIATRYLRLIPTLYIEAGNDANIDVIQADSDTRLENVSNIVTYDSNSDTSITFTTSENNAIENEYFSYYNLALTAGYLITDEAGLGYFGTYKNNSSNPDKNLNGASYIQSYDIAKQRTRTKSYNSGDYFAMSSVFAESASYSDESIPLFTKNDNTGKTTNIYVDELCEQSLIGNSYSTLDGDASNPAKTIIKVYKMGEGSSYSKVFMSTDSNNVSYYTNYLKWTGQQAFDFSDAGDYQVVFFWSMPDGRFTQDSKMVHIHAGSGEISKSVDKTYIENTADADNNLTTEKKDITYTVTYINRSVGKFTVYDVLPYNGDSRYSESLNQEGDKDIRSTKMTNGALKLKSISYEYSFTAEDEGAADAASVSGYYYTTDSISVNEDGSYLSDDFNDVAVTWSEITGGETLPDVNPTALKLIGEQTANGETVVTLTYTVEPTDTSIGDNYVNNAFFTFSDNYIGQEIKGYSNYVTTAVVGSQLSGYAFYDTNSNGRFDANEPSIEGLCAKLIMLNNDGSDGEPLASVETNSEGYYSFENIKTITPVIVDSSTSGTHKQYKVIFEDANDDGRLTLHYGDNQTAEVNLSDVKVTRTLNPSTAESHAGARENSRNLAAEDEKSQMYINENLPTGENILRFNRSTMNDTTYSVYGTVGEVAAYPATTGTPDYYFNRKLQNIGLASSESPDTETYTITVKKLDASNNDSPMEGVQFKIEYDSIGEGNYQTVYYTVDNDGNLNYSDSAEGATAADSVVTGEDGDFTISGLPAGDYRITEVKTLNGYQLLSEPREISLPYTGGVTDEITPDADSVVNEGQFNEYYTAVTLTLKNNKLPSLPFAGVTNNLWLVYLIGSILILTAVGMTIFAYNRRRR